MTAVLIDLSSAELPSNGDPGEDRVRSGHNAVVVLDGASGTDTRVSVAEYVDHLADALIGTLDADPDIPLPHALADALRDTIGALRLMPGESPSSTVSIARRRADEVNLLVLGDSPIYIGPDGIALTDDRLSRLELPTRTKLYERLSHGTGYDDIHQDLVRGLRAEKAPYLNEPDGYWIAEASPEAAHHAVTRTVSANTPWLVMLTDGANDPRRHLGISAAEIAQRSPHELRALLGDLQAWENTDPDAHALPRFKRHDDKTVVVARFP